MKNDFPHLGFGCGLRIEHQPVFLENPPLTVGWLEVIAENYMEWKSGLKPRSVSILEKLRPDYPIAVHGVSLSLGSADPIDLDHLRRVKDLLHRIDAAWYSDHLCWTGVDGEHLHDLFPLPYTEEAMVTVVEKIQRVQDALGRRMLIENVSSYVTYTDSQMTEWDFLREVARRADCGVLLDINNVFVSGCNHGFDPKEYLRAIPFERVGQIHLAGHSNLGTHRIDTHDEKVCDDVWDLFRWYTETFGSRTTMIEWDGKIPEWPVLEEEVLKARAIGEMRREDGDARRNPARI